MKKRFLVRFEMFDNAENRQEEECLEDVLAESEEEAIELIRQWVIDQSVEDGYTVDTEDVGAVDGIRVTGGKYDENRNIEYYYFRVIEKD